MIVYSALWIDRQLKRFFSFTFGVVPYESPRRIHEIGNNVLVLELTVILLIQVCSQKGLSTYTQRCPFLNFTLSQSARLLFGGSTCLHRFQFVYTPIYYASRAESNSWE